MAHRKKRLESQKACYIKRPGHAYQEAYREKHPEYDQRNREQQRNRNKGRSKEVGSMIVNTDPIAQAKLALYFYQHQKHQPVLPRIEIIPTFALELSSSEFRIMNVSCIEQIERSNLLFTPRFTIPFSRLDRGSTPRAEIVFLP